MNTPRALGAILGLFLLAGCSAGSTVSQIDETITPSNPSNPFSETSPYTGADYDTPLPEVAFVLSADAAGPLGSKPPYSRKDVSARMPGYETVVAETALENRVRPTLAVLKDGQQVLQLFKGAKGEAAEVHAVSGIVAGPAGEQVGMTFAQAGMRRSNCRVGKNLWRGMAVCPSKGASNVTLVFALPGYRGPFSQMPPENMIGKATLQRIVWKPN